MEERTWYLLDKRIGGCPVIVTDQAEAGDAVLIDLDSMRSLGAVVGLVGPANQAEDTG